MGSIGLKRVIQTSSVPLGGRAVDCGFCHNLNR